MKKLFLYITLGTFMSLSAFAQSNKLTATEWKLTSMNGERINNSKAYLEFDSDGTRFSGNAGCNRMFGSVDMQGRRIDFGGIGSTKMFCGQPGVARIETRFLKTLPKITGYQLRRNSLELISGKRTLLTFTGTPKSTPDSKVGLHDKKWTLTEANGIRVPAGRSAFLVFDQAKKSAGGNTSCNVFGGTYSAAGATIKFTEIISTMRACVEDDRMSIERAFLDGLRNADRYEISGGKLVLYRGNRILLRFNGEPK